MKSWIFGAGLAALAAPLGAQSGGNAAYRAQWGILADMAGGDYYYAKSGYAYAFLRLEWVRPGIELRLVEAYSKKSIKDCRLTAQGLSDVIPGSCDIGKSKPMPIEAQRAPDGTVSIATISSDFLLGQQRTKWGRFRAGKAPGLYELRVAGIETRHLLPANDPNLQFPKYAQWMPETVAGIARVGPASTGPQSRPADPSAAPPPTPPADEPPV